MFLGRRAGRVALAALRALGVGIAHLVAPFERQDDRDLALGEQPREPPGLAPADDADREPELVGQADPALDVARELGLAPQAPAGQELGAELELAVVGRPRAALRGCAAAELRVPARVEEVLAQLRDVAHQRRGVSGARGREGRVLERRGAHDHVARGRLARRRERAPAGEQVAVRRGEQRAEALLAPFARQLLAQREHVDRAERGLYALAVRRAHRDVDVGRHVGRQVAVGDGLGRRRARVRVRVDEGRHHAAAFAGDLVVARRHGLGGGHDGPDATVLAEQVHARRRFAGAQAHVGQRGAPGARGRGRRGETRRASEQKGEEHGGVLEGRAGLCGERPDSGGARAVCHRSGAGVRRPAPDHSRKKGRHASQAQSAGSASAKLPALAVLSPT